MDSPVNGTVLVPDLSHWMARIGDYFAPPSAPPLPVHIEERNKARGLACTRLLEQLHQPDGTLKLSGIHLGKIARATGIKFKRLVRALKDLVDIGIIAAYDAPAHIVQTAKGQTTGNRCGHHPARPRFFAPPEWHKNHPGIIKAAIEKIRDYYQRPAALLPLLNAVNGSDRQQRSERREACMQMLAALLHYTDLITLRVGRPQADGSFAGILMVELAGLAGLSQVRPDGSICIRRAERAIADLEAAGIITIHPIAEKLADATYRGLAAIRTVCAALFDAVGLGGRLKKERADAVEREKKRQKKRQRKNLAHIKMGLNAIEGDQKPPTEAKAQQQRQEEQAAQRRNATAIRLLELCPDRMNEARALMKALPDASAEDIAAMLAATGPPS